MKRFEVRDNVRIDITDMADQDFDRYRYHGRAGEIVNIFEDDADEQTGDERDAYLFEVEFVNGEYAQLRWRDIRPVSSQ